MEGASVSPSLRFVSGRKFRRQIGHGGTSVKNIEYCLQNARHRAKSYTKPFNGETERSGKRFRGNKIRFGAESLFYILQVTHTGL